MKPSNLKTMLEKAIPAKAPVLIKGAPGIGKTEIVKQACDAVKARLIISHPVVNDPTDYKGLPALVDGEARFLPYKDLKELISAETLTVFFLDDLGQAPPAVQAAAMQLILERRINGHKVSDNVTFIAATNRKADKAGVSGILEPVKSRFATIIELETDLHDWTSWALSADLPTELIAFFHFRPELLHAFTPTADIENTPSPRTAAHVAKLMSLDLPVELEFEAYQGASGKDFCTEFLAFIKIYRELPNPDMIIMNPDTAEIPARNDVTWALCGALARKANDQTWASIMKYAARLSAMYSVLLVQMSTKLNPGLINTRQYIQWATDNQDLFKN